MFQFGRAYRPWLSCLEQLWSAGVSSEQRTWSHMGSSAVIALACMKPWELSSCKKCPSTSPLGWPLPHRAPHGMLSLQVLQHWLETFRMVVPGSFLLEKGFWVSIQVSRVHRGNQKWHCWWAGPGSASFPFSSLRLLDEPARKTGLLLSFLWRLILYSYHSYVRCFRVIFFSLWQPRRILVYFFKRLCGARFDYRCSTLCYSAQTGRKAVWTLPF